MGFREILEEIQLKMFLFKKFEFQRNIFAIFPGRNVVENNTFESLRKEVDYILMGRRFSATVDHNQI